MAQTVGCGPILDTQAESNDAASTVESQRVMQGGDGGDMRRLLEGG